MTSLAQEVLPNIWIGGFAAMESKKFLKKNGIRRILSLGHFKQIYSTADFIHKIIAITDNPESNIIRLFPETNTFIQGAIDHNEPILVHCLAGVSRSPTAVAAYLMHRDRCHWKLALATLKQVRPFIDPNPGFKQQLQLYQAMDYQFDPSHPAYAKHILCHPYDAAHLGHAEYNGNGDHSP
ncbi:phosphatases II [Hesseltinella vesiculosa]|uniref:Phosphatases II n=1 Tax=Hesseltinella vesiculosa TaxID=101127 RepID=A0A1X2GIJ9_9FUNG|nr:phosphatases II [Hesseltinella vesiculosa]